MEENDPIRKEKTLFEKFRDNILGNRKKKVYITTYNPHTKKENNQMIGWYRAKHEEEIKENMLKIADAMYKSGYATTEFKKRYR